MTTSSTKVTPTAGLDRAALLLDAFDGPGRLTLAEIVRRTGLPRSSAHRMLERLVQLRWLRRSGRDYELGMRLFELGSLAVHQDRIHQAALPFLHELHRRTGYVVHLAILEGTDVVYLEKICGRFGMGLPSRVGGRQPAHCTSVGKALLAYSPQSVVDRVLAAGLQRKTTFSIGSAPQLHAELGHIRDRGAAFDRGEALTGVSCVAAPIGTENNVVGAISVCGPSNQMKLDHRLAAPVRVAAAGAWRALSSEAMARPSVEHSVA
ncbi:IclR family transcriptional regulator [Rhodococcus sp. D2-41]|uniref:IclR family transcriptional regulator n=1 Tax=Speluncibacter jeojiensis TaxID=2710754 RepID=A0A9X4M190_9ACTN|nr:IclR family transcriptional regulator [Rhodococcus sp. D2-41]MDG3009753.1 IclR family transcriptional regulator [Rhodococcus sp. D2-41]MDG3014502.1 IclR family transcriptional regulator [Corynebacteriales bacterium D3-21]